MEKSKQVHLPDLIILDILKKLPEKSLVRFKSVCKTWQSFINQLKYHNQKLIVSYSSNIQLIDLEASEIKAVRLDFPFETKNSFKVIGSCNGLLCIAIEKEGFVLWNPWIGAYKRIAVDSPFSVGDEKYRFGYDHSTNDYNIVRFPYRRDRPIASKMSVEIYSLKTNFWKKQSLPWVFISVSKSQPGGFSRMDLSIGAQITLTSLILRMIILF
ncbi:hypothetical protein LWI29_014359 [Acer saccharum]|uniref:F-box domain-containing protein n=1 Tax=Acer saccharum TaxID=4024 RepID=A0AA39TM89_ACESA|nr:hypothetical protein LWI29_014359 [Acer saccharum]